MRSLHKLIGAAVLAAAAVSGLPAQTKPSLDLLGWYGANSALFKSVNNGAWSTNPKDAPSQEELTKILDFACDTQTSVNATEYFFLAVQDPQTQAEIVGGSAGKAAATAGTATVLVLADQVADPKNHKEPYGQGYPQIGMAYYDVGLATGQLVVAAHALGFSTHIFSGPTGPLVGGQAVGRSALMARIFDLGKILKGKDWVKVNGGSGKSVSVDGNCQFVAAVVIGKPSAKLDAVAAATNGARPKNYAFLGAR